MDFKDLDCKLTVNKFGLTQLDLRRKNLIDFPENLFLFHKLEVLLASHNLIVSVPSQIGKLRKLKVVDFSHNKIRHLPESLSGCTNLNELYLQNNRIFKLPHQLCSLNNLKYLQLSNNLLEHLPPNIDRIESLKWLDISMNSLWLLPKMFQNLVELINLNLRENAFIEFPMQLISLKKLEFLDISYNKINTLPPDLNSMKNLRIVNMAFNQFSNFPASLCDLKSLEYLDLSNNHLTSVSSRVSKLPHLKVLLISNNYLKDLLDNLPSVETLDVSGNILRQLSVTNMKSLRVLIASKNQLNSLPSGVFHLHEMEELHLSGNQIKHLPQDIILMNKLKKLDISGNKVKLVPKALYEMASLEDVNLTGDFKKIKSERHQNKKVAAYIMEPATNNSSKFKIKIDKHFGISKLFPRSKDAEYFRKKQKRSTQTLNFKPKNQDQYFYFSGLPSSPKTIVKRSQSLHNIDGKVPVSGHAWSDETSRQRRSRETEIRSGLGEESLSQNFKTLNFFHEIEYPSNWLEEEEPRTTSIRFNKEFPSTECFQPFSCNNLTKTPHSGRESSTRHFKSKQHHHPSCNDVKDKVRRNESQGPTGSQGFTAIHPESSDLFDESMHSSNFQDIHKENMFRSSDDFDKFSTTVTVNEDVGDTLSLGFDDFHFHPSNVKDAKLLELAKDLENLLGKEIVTPFTKKGRRH